MPNEARRHLENANVVVRATTRDTAMLLKAAPLSVMWRVMVLVCHSVVELCV